MIFLVNYRGKDGFVEKGADFKGNKELEKVLVARGIIGQKPKAPTKPKAEK